MAKQPPTDKTNSAPWLDQLQAAHTSARAMGGARYIDKQHALGRMTARERIDGLLDPGSFDEYGALVRSEQEQMRARTPADGKVAGLGHIQERPVIVHADDATVLAGSGGRLAMQKIKRSFAYAVKRGYPIVNLGDAGGVRMPDNMGSANMMGMTQINFGTPRNRQVPYIATIMGQCFGDPSWCAARADVVVMVKGCVMAVSGPKIIAGATGEEVSEQELGGWELHARVSGQVDLFAEDEAQCLQMVREVLSYLPSNAGQLPPVVKTTDPSDRALERARTLVPEHARQAFDMRRLLKMVADDGRMLELKPHFDPSLVTALARIDGHSVGFLASNSIGNAGAMGPGACEKATSFICLCDSFHIPIIGFHDSPGFFVSKAAEERKMPLKIMTFLDAWHQSTVPRFGVIVRKSYGFSHRHLVGGQMQADYLVAWPSADISFMALEGAVEVVYGRQIEAAQDPIHERSKREAEINDANSPWAAAEAHWLDDIIDPRDTRAVLAAALRRARGPDGVAVRSSRLLANWPTGF
jgi:acetyl-CoA carboxylase carboxyltransferase component